MARKSNASQPENPGNTEDNNALETALLTELEETLSQYDETTIIATESEKKISPEQLNTIIDKLAKNKEIDRSTAIVGMAALFRKGAANAGAPDSMEVDLLCPKTKRITSISRYDLVTVLQLVAGHKTIRKMAEAMAPQMIQGNLSLIEKNPLLNLQGDLANRINRKLFVRKEPPLTRKEAVCCATYAQWMPNLDELAESKRLASLLNEDLNARRKKNSAGDRKKSQKSEPPKTTKGGKKDRKKLFGDKSEN